MNFFHLISAGLFLSLGSGIVGLLFGKPYLTGEWFHLEIPDVGTLELGTPIIFDLGVYLVVIGVTVTVVLSFMEE